MTARACHSLLQAPSTSGSMHSGFILSFSRYLLFRWKESLYKSIAQGLSAKSSRFSGWPVTPQKRRHLTPCLGPKHGHPSSKRQPSKLPLARWTFWVNSTPTEVWLQWPAIWNATWRLALPTGKNLCYLNVGTATYFAVHCIELLWVCILALTQQERVERTAVKNIALVSGNVLYSLGLIKIDPLVKFKFGSTVSDHGASE